MNHKYRLLLRFHSFVSFFYTTVLAHAPFTFSPFNLQVYNLPDSLWLAPVAPYAEACPAEYKVENFINEDDSMDHKALFMKEYYTKSDFIWTDKAGIQCKKEFKLAAAFNRVERRIEFGYEVYFEKNSGSSEEDTVHVYDEFETSDFSDYGPIEEARSLWRQLYSDWILRSSQPTIQYSSEDIPVGFFWIPRVTLKYSSSKWSVVSSSYTLYRNVAQEFMVKCDDHNLGNAFYRKKHGPFDNFYSLENQKKIFSLVELPELPENSICKTTHECIAKYDFLMPYHFRSSLKSRVSCSNLATIPIWCEIVEPLLQKLEIFLFAMSQVTEKMLTILPGVSGTLQFTTKNARKPKPMSMYLYPKEKKIPIPKIIYKIIRYKSYECKTKKAVCWFDMVVVIHNHPGPIQNQMICPQDVCKDYGWESIKLVNGLKKGQVSENIYCCQLDKKMQKYLDFSVGKKLRDNLNLKKFPLYDATLGNNKPLNLQNRIEEKMKLLQIEMIQSETKL